MKHAATILAALILANVSALARTPHILARWGGENVVLTEIATGRQWQDTYENFFANCKGYHPNAVGVKVVGSLPASFLARERAAKLAKRSPAPAPKPAPQIIAKAPAKRSAGPPEPTLNLPVANFTPQQANDSGLLLPPALPERVTLTEALRSMALGIPPRPDWIQEADEIEAEPPEPAEIIAGPKTQNLEPVNITDRYDVRRRAIITAGRLDEILGGKLAGTGSIFITEARKNGICPVFLAGVAMHESANGTSKIVRERNNAFGICPGGSYARYDSIAENIAAAARLLGGSSYAGGSRYTIGEIQKRYCPIGQNDPKGLNHHWRSGVVHHMKAFFGETLHVASL